MYSIRKWIFRPKRSDTSLLAQFFYTDEELNMVAAELDSFDGRKDPERCTALVNHLRVCQDKVLTIVEKIMQEVIPTQRAPRDFRVKFPDDVLQESLAGQLWFGAECLAAGSSIMNREVESASMRPLAKALTRHLDFLRTGLRDQCLRNLNIYSDVIKESLMVFDRLFAEFELSYVSAMVPVKTMKEYEVMQDVVVLFCETVNRAMKLNLLTQDMIDDYDPALMFTIPRLAIVCGLLVFPEGPLNPDMDPMSMSEMFRPFQTLLYKIRELLWTLNKRELWLLEKSLCSAEEPGLYREIQPIQLEEDLAEAHSMEVGQADGQSNAAKLGQSKMDSHSQSNGSSSEPESSSSGLPGLSPPSFIGVDRDSEYRMITHSPSTITVVANSSCSSSDDVSETSTRHRYLSVESAPSLHHSSVPHQDSIDSGMLSGSELATPASPTLEQKQERERQRLRRCLGVRQLRQSRSWPEGHGDYTVRRARKLYGDIQESTEDMGSDVHRVSYANRSGSQEFNFNLPLNTEITGPNEVISTGGERQKQQLIYTDHNHSFDSAEGTADSGQQVSFVTDILNEVFVTDSTFQESVTPPGSSAPEDLTHRAAEPTSTSCDCDSDVKTDSDENDDDGDDNVFVPAKCECSSQEKFDPKVHRDNCSLQISDNHFDGDEVVSQKKGLPSGSTTTTSCSKPTNNRLLNKDSTQQQFNESDRPRIGSFSSQDQERGRKGSFTARFAGEEKVVSADCLDVPKIQKLKYGETVSSAMVRSHSPSMDCDWDRESYCSSDTSSYNSESNDDEEIALAIQAAELAARREARSRFRSSADLIHRLFVCISGVADQLQTNYASDLRNILKAVFECYASEPILDLENAEAMAESELQSDDVSSTHQGESSSEEEDNRTDSRDEVSREPEEAPAWVPDGESPHCSSCKVPFTFVRRRHHCRNCGKIFCSRCSSNNVPLPHYGHDKPVRVCNHCFVFQVTPFTVEG